MFLIRHYTGIRLRLLKIEDGTWNENTSISYYENPVGLLMETYGGNQWHMTRLSGKYYI